MIISDRTDKNKDKLELLDLSQAALNGVLNRRMSLAAMQGDRDDAASPAPASSSQSWSLVADAIRAQLKIIDEVSQGRAVLIDKNASYVQEMVEDRDLERALLEKFGVTLNASQAVAEAEAIFRSSDLGTVAPSSLQDMCQREADCLAVISTELFPELSRLRKIAPELKARQQFLSDLECARVTFEELVRNLSEGISFYRNTQSLVRPLRAKIKEFSIGRASERQTFTARFGPPPSSSSGLYSGSSLAPPPHNPGGPGSSPNPYL
jgi:hypothetical protein